MDTLLIQDCNDLKNKHLKLQILILLKYQLNNIIIPTLEVLETHVGLFSVAA